MTSSVNLAVFSPVWSAWEESQYLHTWGQGTWWYWPLWVGSKWLSHVKEFKYLRVLFMTKGKMEHEIVVASTVLQVLHCIVLIEIELSLNVKLPIYQSKFQPSPKVMTLGSDQKIILLYRLWVGMAGFLCWVSDFLLRERALTRSAALLCWRSQLRWSGYLIRIHLLMNSRRVQLIQDPDQEHAGGIYPAWRMWRGRRMSTLPNLLRHTCTIWCVMGSF